MHSIHLIAVRSGGLWLAICVLLNLGSVDGQSQPQPSVDFSSAEFRNRFMDTYGTLGELEPKITQEESKLLKSILEDIGANPTQAYLKLSAAVNNNSSAALDYVLGNLKFQSGDERSAATHYQSALRKFPDFRRAHQNLGYALVRQDLFTKGQDHLLRAVELGAMDGELMGVIAFTHWNEEQYAASEAAYRQALLFNAKRADWKLGLALSVTRQGRDTEAIAIYDELIELEPKNHDYWLAQADIYLRQNEEEAALMNYEMARRLGATNPSVIANLASLYLNQGLLERSVSIFTSLKSPMTDTLWSRSLNGLEIIMSQDEWTLAEMFWAHLNKLNSNSLTQKLNQKWNRLSAWRALHQESYPQAASLLKELIKTDPLDGRSMLLLADALTKQNKSQEAVLVLERASRLTDYRKQALRLLINDALSNERFDDAYQKLSLLQNEGFDPEIAETMRQLERVLANQNQNP